MAESEIGGDQPSGDEWSVAVRLFNGDGSCLERGDRTAREDDRLIHPGARVAFPLGQRRHQSESRHRRMAGVTCLRRSRTRGQGRPSLPGAQSQVRQRDGTDDWVAASVRGFERGAHATAVTPGPGDRREGPRAGPPGIHRRRRRSGTQCRATSIPCRSSRRASALDDAAGARRRGRRACRRRLSPRTRQTLPVPSYVRPAPKECGSASRGGSRPSDDGGSTPDLLAYDVTFAP